MLCLTQVIFVQFNLLHHRGHDEGEGLPVEEVQRVADEHAEEDDHAVVAVTCGPHDSTRSNKILRKKNSKDEKEKNIPSKPSLQCSLVFGSSGI